MESDRSPRTSIIELGQRRLTIPPILASIAPILFLFSRYYAEYCTSDAHLPTHQPGSIVVPRGRRVANRLAWTLAAFASWACIVHGAEDEEFASLRAALVDRDIAGAGITHEGVLKALRATPRHEFVPNALRDSAYLDVALPIGEEQTISPPYVVAYMTQQLDPQPHERVLEIGTGSGYQAAVLSPLVAEVDTIEIVTRLGRRAERTLKRLGYKNVRVLIGDGYKGWPERAPYDKIIVTCSPEEIPQPLLDQLREGGQIVIPVGQRYRQNLYRVTKENGRLEREVLQATLFVPMTGSAEKLRKVVPNPQRPELFNGGFEQTSPQADALEKQEVPEGWHYLRQAKLMADPSAPEGKRWLSLESNVPTSPCHALQGFAVDGRAVARLNLKVWVRGEGLEPGRSQEEQAALIITFYDERRAAIDQVTAGPWKGSFGWRRETLQVPVPLSAREAIVRIGLHGGVGRLDVDAIELGADR